MKSKLSFFSKRRQFNILLIFAFAILGIKLTFYYLESNFSTTFPKIGFYASGKNKIILTDFNPNDLDEGQWEKLGFTNKQAKTILKYKKIFNGHFSSKDQIKKCFAISEEKYREIEPYILLPEKAPEKVSYANYRNRYEKKSLLVFKKFNPDSYSVADWQKLGFSERQALAITKYKDFLGGSFISKEKFKACFIINEENYTKLAPFLLLPEKTPEHLLPKNNLKSDKNNIKYTHFNPNELDAIGWQNLGFTEKQAAVIINYKNKNLKGSFRSLEDLENCFVISEEKMKILKPYINWSLPNKNPEKNLASSPKNIIPKTDFNKIDLNKITFAQLLEFGFDEKAAGSFIGFRNKLGGFINKNQILETYNLDKNLTEKLILNASINTTSITKHALTEAPEEWLKNHPYFRYYAQKILYYRVSYPQEKEIFKKLKAKPEDEMKMKLYLK